MPPIMKKKVKPVKKAKTEEETTVISGQLQKKVKMQKARQKLQRGVIFIKHLPHGFFEDQLRGYFEQFGSVTRLRLARSKLTGGTKGYAYIEFEYPEVAEVAAETMDNYLMFNKVVKAAYIPPEKQFYNYFKTSVRQVKNKAGKPIYVSSKTAAKVKYVKKFNDSSEESYRKRTARKLQKIQQLNKKYEHLGIDFNRIIAGPKNAKEILDYSDTPESTGNNKEGPTKNGKRRNKSVEKSSKKSKKEPELEDLLGETLNEDSDDEDYVAEALSDDDKERDEEKSDKSVQLEDLLGETLNDDSDDDEWAADGSIESEENEEEADDQVTESDVDEDDDNEEDEDEEEKSPIKKKSKKIIKGNPVKARTVKENNLDKLIKHKKNTGGIQKVKKAQLKKPKISKAKNVMQAALTKQLAQPMQLMKKKLKTSKKQN